LSVQEVLHVVVTPWSHFLQAATHWSKDFGLKAGYSSFAQLLMDPVVSLSGEQALITRARAAKAAKRFIRPPSQQSFDKAAPTLRFSPFFSCRNPLYPQRFQPPRLPCIGN
jgi:hypothetical protein